MTTERIYALSIAGFDPSGGAGVLADIKTFEQLGVYGFGALTANTFQNDVDVKKVDWLPVAAVIEQVDILLERFAINFFKIGIIENSSALLAITAHIMQRRPQATIVWDPVLSSSSGYDFFNQQQPIEALLKNIHLLTPNLPEFTTLLGNEEKALALSAHTCIYLKGGHSRTQPGTDYLFWRKEKHIFEPEAAEAITPKHGSGCVLSSALCAHLALGYTIAEACHKSKRYMEKFLSSHPSLLGRHQPISNAELNFIEHD